MDCFVVISGVLVGCDLVNLGVSMSDGTIMFIAMMAVSALVILMEDTND